MGSSFVCAVGYLSLPLFALFGAVMALFVYVGWRASPRGTSLTSCAATGALDVAFSLLAHAKKRKVLAAPPKPKDVTEIQATVSLAPLDTQPRRRNRLAEARDSGVTSTVPAAVPLPPRAPTEARGNPETDVGSECAFDHSE
jgi:hypothetical protein